MKTIFHSYRDPRILKYYMLFFMAVYAISLTWSNYLISASIVLLSVSLLFEIDPLKQKITFLHSCKKHVQTLGRNPLMVSCISIFLSICISGIWSDQQWNDWLRFCRIFLPMLILPCIFIIHGAFTKKEIIFLVLLSIGASLVTSIWVMYNYFIHMEQFNYEILKGKAIKTPLSHLHFSTVMAASCILSYYLSTLETYIHKKIWKNVLLVLSLYFFLVVIILSVKTGWLGLFSGIVVYGTAVSIHQKKFKPFLLSMLAIIIAVVLAISFVPSVQKKFSYSLWQVGEWNRGNFYQYSDLERFISMHMAWKIIEKEPLLGCGIGNVTRYTEKVYAVYHPGLRVHLAHNQFLFNWAYAGALALISLVAFVYFAFLQKQKWKIPIYVSIMAVVISSMLFEATLATQLGICVFLFYALMMWMVEKVEEEDIQKT